MQGLRLRHHYVLCGALLRVWGRVANVMAEVSSSSYLQIVRLKTKDGKKQVGEWVGTWAAPGRWGARAGSGGLTQLPPHAGIKIPEGCVHRVLQELRQMDAEVQRRRRPAPPPAPRLPLALPFGPGEVLDLTYSPPAEAFPPSALPPPPPHFAFPQPPPDPAALAHQGCDINFKEVLEDMLRSLHAAPAEPPGPLMGAGTGPERQSVIHFSPPFPNS